MSEKYLVEGGNTFFITMSLKTSSLVPQTATFILGETCEWTTFGVFSGMSTSGQYVRGKNQNTGSGRLGEGRNMQVEYCDHQTLPGVCN